MNDDTDTAQDNTDIAINNNDNSTTQSSDINIAFLNNDDDDDDGNFSKQLFKISYEDIVKNIEKLKFSEGYVCAENLSLLDVVKENWLLYMKSQLLTREKIINIFSKYLKTMIENRNKAQSDLEHIQCKNCQLETKLKHLKTKLQKKEKLLKKHKKSFKNGTDQDSQTDAISYDWDWYYQNSNYNYDYQYNVEANCKENIAETVNNNFEIKKENSSENFLDSKDQDNSLINHDNDQDYSDLNEQNISKDEPNPSKYAETSTYLYSPDAQNVSEDAVAEKNTHLEVADVKKEGEDNGTMWNSSNITEEVKELAEEVTNQLGYVYVDEIGMYYDHTSGYYYDQKTSLYYDGKTGTYFYYDYEANSYQFYAQVSPTQSTESADKIQPKKKKTTLIKSEEKEEGECSESEDEIYEETAEEIISGLEKDKPDIAPSLRLMVMNEDLKGSLHIVTLDGGTIGREGDNQVLIKNRSVSKMHAEISYKSDGPNDHHYYIEDLGSINGTVVRGQRLSDSRTRSSPVEIGHGWEIKCGDVILSCHVHPGLLTCNECEPGLIAGVSRGNKTEACVTEGSKKKLEKERRRQNKAIRKKFSLGYFEPTLPKNPNYKDRAGKRREAVGSDNPYEKTQIASIDTNISKENKGFQLLQKMGWSEGQSLGVTNSGLTEPIVPICLSGRKGLGSIANPFDEIPIKTKNSKINMLEIMKEKSFLLQPKDSLTNSESVPATSQPMQTVKFTPASENSNGS